jgi:hypothetical protein
MFDYAIETRLVTVNPVGMVKTRYIGKSRERSRILTADEIRRYLRTVYESDMRRQFKLALHILLLTLKRRLELLFVRALAPTKGGALELLCAHHVQTFPASADVNDSFLIFQRLTEGAYPARMISDLLYLISLKKAVPGCAIVDALESVYPLQCQRNL